MSWVLLNALKDRLHFLGDDLWRLDLTKPTRLIVDNIKDPYFKFIRNENDIGAIKYLNYSDDPNIGEEWETGDFVVGSTPLHQILQVSSRIVVVEYRCIDENTDEPYSVIALYNVFEAEKNLATISLEEVEKIANQLGYNR